MRFSLFGLNVEIRKSCKSGIVDPGMAVDVGLRPPGPFPQFLSQKAKKKSIDPESQKLWENFKKSQACWACDCLQQLRNDLGFSLLFLQTQDNNLAAIDVNYCPKCGRKLVYKK